MVALHRRGNRFVHESSYSLLVLAVLELVGSMVVAGSEGSETTIGDLPLKDVIATALGVGAIFPLAAFFLRNFFGQTVTFDRREKTVRVRSREGNVVIPWEDVVWLEVSAKRMFRRCQLNLVWRDDR